MEQVGRKGGIAYLGLEDASLALFGKRMLKADESTGIRLTSRFLRRRHMYIHHQIT